MSNKIFHMTVPFAGALYVSIEAETEEEARERIWDTQCRLDIKDESNDPKIHVDLGEWDLYERLVEGNVCYATPREVEIDEIEELEGE